MRKYATITFITAILGLTLSGQFAFASTGTIQPPNQYAWSDNGGYVNWDATGSNVTVSDTTLTGYIWSAGFGWINLSPATGGVTNSNGTLSGYAWGTNTGWIDFDGVTIDSNGLFHGHTVAQSTFGTMTFDCTNCSVVTSWHPTSRTTTAPAATSSGSNGPPVQTGALSYGYQTGMAASSTATGSTPLPPGAALGFPTTIQNAGSPPPQFVRDLTLGSRGADVQALQTYLNSHGFTVLSTGPGSAGQETTFFGFATQAALARFQSANGIAPAVGYFGPETRLFISLTIQLQELLLEINALQSNASSTTP